MKLSLTWDLDRFYPGGSASQKLQECFTNIETGVQQLRKNLREREHLPSVLTLMQTLSNHLRQVRSFTHCLLAQDAKDLVALSIQNRLTQLTATFKTLSVVLDEWLLAIDDENFALLLDGELKEIAFPLEERRTFAREKLGAEDEAIIHDLAVDGYHGWSNLWDTLIRDLPFSYRNKQLSFNQMENLLSLPSREERKEAFTSIEQTLGAFQNSFAQTLNHLAGFRLAVYKKRGWDCPLKEPLHLNRLSRQTLETMWEVTQENEHILLDFLHCKAGLLDQPKLSWFDLAAPLKHQPTPLSYRESSIFIIKNFSPFSPKLAAFSERALQERWVDAENRPNKAPGGFCAFFPLHQESRIFMTYTQSSSSLFTLAHELGHAFHNSILSPLPEMAQHCRMNLAETASTMSELIITQAAIAEAESKQERLALLHDHLQRAVSYLLNIRARFLFEHAFYSARKEGFVSADRLCAMMEKAQKTSYRNHLESYHPLFWAAKMHFYLSMPFYNFPYTFGYLFSLGLYALASNLPQFETRYIRLLRDTGQMTTEDLARKHLDVDIKEPSFWQLGFTLLQNDLVSFRELTQVDRV